jgi:hypothetical protein
MAKINDPLPERDFRNGHRIRRRCRSPDSTTRTSFFARFDSRDIASKNINGEQFRNTYAGFFTPRFVDDAAFSSTVFVKQIRGRCGRLINGGEPDTRNGVPRSSTCCPWSIYYMHLGDLRSSAKNSNAPRGGEDLDVAFNQWSSAPTDVKCALGRSPVGVLPLVGLGSYFEWLSVIHDAQGGALRGLTATNRAFVRSMASFLSPYPRRRPQGCRHGDGDHELIPTPLISMRRSSGIFPSSWGR